MLGFLSTTQEVGYYSAASKLVRMVRNLFPAVFTVLFARFSYYHAQKNTNSYNDLAEKTINFILCFSIPIVAGFIILASPVIKLLCGISYIPAIDSVIVLSPLIFISSCSSFLGGVLMITQGKEKQYLYTTVSAAIIDLILNFLLIPKKGAFGASFATLITELFIFLVYVIISKNILSKIHIGIPLLQYFISTFFMTITLLFVKKFITNTIFIIVLSTLIGIIIYVFFLQIMRNEYFITTKKDVLKKIINKIKPKSAQ